MRDAKLLFVEAFDQLMEQKPIDHIRVAEIAEGSGLTKQTFYRHFTDKYELLEYSFRLKFAEPLARIAANEPFAGCCDSLLLIGSKNRSYMKNAFGSNDVNSLFKAMRDALRDAYHDRLTMQGIADEDEVKFMADFYVKGFVGMTRRWLSIGMDLPRDVIVNYAVACLPQKLAPFFK